MKADPVGAQLFHVIRRKHRLDKRTDKHDEANSLGTVSSPLCVCVCVCVWKLERVCSQTQL